MFDKIKEFKTGVKNLIRYFNVIWNTREWDHRPLYSLLQFKLKMMLKNHVEVRRFVGVENVIEQLTECVELLDKILQNKYFEGAGFDEYVKKYGPFDFENEIENETEKSEEDLELQCQRHDEMLKICNNAYTSRMNDIKQLFDIMAKHSEEWWD